jgi:hypothetical protein
MRIVDCDACGGAGCSLCEFLGVGGIEFPDASKRAPCGPRCPAADLSVAAQMRRALLQTYDFEQQRKLVERLVPRGVGDFGFHLQADGQVEVKGALEAPECDPRKLTTSTP